MAQTTSRFSDDMGPQPRRRRPSPWVIVFLVFAAIVIGAVFAADVFLKNLEPLPLAGTPTPTPTVTVTITPTPTPTPTPTSTRIPAGTDTYGPSARVGEYLEPIIPVDHGPRKYATGTVTNDVLGRPLSYTVAPEDVIDYVQERLGFGYDGHYLVTINQVRRGDTATLYVGDTLNLSPFHVTSIGNINGRVLDEKAPKPLPPQQ